MSNYPAKTYVLIVTTLASFITTFMSSAINIALPPISNELNIDAVSLGWVATAYLLASVIFNVPFGKIADIYGRKKIFSCGIVIFTITSLLLSISSSAIMLIALRFFQGIGGAMITSVSIAVLTSVFPVGERGRVIGLNMTAVYLGVSLGPIIGGLLTQYFGWRSIFLVNVPLGIIIITLISWKVKGDWIEAKDEKFDIIGSIIYSLMFVAIIYGFTSLPNILGWVLILIGIIGLATFIIWETRATSPVLNIDLFRKNRAFAFACLSALIMYISISAVGFLLSLYLQYIKGFSPQNAGFILVSQPIMQVIFSPLAGRISDRIQPHLIASAGMVCTTIGLLLFAFLTEETAMPLIIGSLVLVGFGCALFVSPNTNAAMSSVDKKFYGVASATIITMIGLGMALGMGIVMLLFSLYIGRVQITPEYYAAFLRSARVAFIISSVLCLLGIFASIARGKTSTVNH